jgi:hypothetical protein
MPRRKKNIVEETPIAVLEEEVQEVQEVVEVVPKKLFVAFKQEVPIPGYDTIGTVPVGTITYYESTDEVIVTSEVEFEEHMTHLSLRDLCLPDGTMVAVTHRREWMENLPKNVFSRGIFASKVRVSNEN